MTSKIENRKFADPNPNPCVEINRQTEVNHSPIKFDGFGSFFLDTAWLIKLTNFRYFLAAKIILLKEIEYNMFISCKITDSSISKKLQ